MNFQQLHGDFEAGLRACMRSFHDPHALGDWATANFMVNHPIVQHRLGELYNSNYWMYECTDSDAFRHWATERTDNIKLPCVAARLQELIVGELFDQPTPQVPENEVQQAVDDLEELLSGPRGKRKREYECAQCGDSFGLLKDWRTHTYTHAQWGGAADEPYTFKRINQRTYGRNVVDTTYRVKFNEEWRGEKLLDLHQQVTQMFEDVLTRARGDLSDEDLGRIVINHDGLDNPIVVPLKRWGKLNAAEVMTKAQNVLNSHQQLRLDQSFDVTIGTVNIPKGAGRQYLFNLKDSVFSKQSLFYINNNDFICMARAIIMCWGKVNCVSNAEFKQSKQNIRTAEAIVNIGKVPKWYYNKMRTQGRSEQETLAKAICNRAGIPLDRKLNLTDIPKFEDLLDVQILVIGSSSRSFLRVGADKPIKLFLFLNEEEEHFHGIASITGFFSTSYFCETCLKPFNKHKNHVCRTSCDVCHSSECVAVDRKVCENCNRACRSVDCYNRHREVRDKLKNVEDKSISYCQAFWQCPSCKCVLDTRKRDPKDHQCFEWFCKLCASYVMDGHLCYMRSEKDASETNPRYILFDFECTQNCVHECQEGYKPPAVNPHCASCLKLGTKCTACHKCVHCKGDLCGRVVHRPNLVIAQSVCDTCQSIPLTAGATCSKCGSRCSRCSVKEKTGCFKMPPCANSCGHREVLFRGDTTTEDFGKWLFSSQHKDCVVMAHNMRGYDGHFLLEYVLSQGIQPDQIIYAGTKIMMMRVGKGLNMRILDSLNYLPMKLSALTKSFGLNELKKGYFPHFFNTGENQNYIGPYPEPRFYGADYMGKSEREAFLTWHDEKSGETFNFAQEIIAYCRSDVDILRQACMSFKDLLYAVTASPGKTPNAINPFRYVTIASVCMGVYRTKFHVEEHSVKVLAENGTYLNTTALYKNKTWSMANAQSVKFLRSPIAHIPSRGYVHRDQYSKISIQWLEWMAAEKGIYIQHALNEGELCIPNTRYKIDGYASVTNTCFEYHGCHVHGHTCIKGDRSRVKCFHTGLTMDELYNKTMRKRDYLISLGYNYICMWHCEFSQILHDNIEVQRFVEGLDLQERLVPHDSFFGGRTNATKLHYKIKPGQTGQYMDVTSLYPWTMKTCEYPVGHPQIITKNFKNIKNYFGLAKIKVLPPHKLYFPVLPYRAHGKLLFPLCRKCADTQSPNCHCTNDERAFIGTWCTPEILEALNQGYEILKIYEVYHWDERKKGLFAEYIDAFLKIKQEASGWPSWCQTEADKTTYIDQYKAHENINLDHNSIKKNPGLRSLAKLCLNSFWGKFGQRSCMKQTEFIPESKAHKFFDLLSDPRKRVIDFNIASHSILHVQWEHAVNVEPESDITNIFIATFTTCWARLKLYSALSLLKQSVLYHDTDSVIFVCPSGEQPLLPGDFLGDWTSELDPEEHITEFISAGPKNYAYRTNKGAETCKVKGFSLNYTNSQLINFEAMKEIVFDKVVNISIVQPSKITRQAQNTTIYNRPELKTYKKVYDKRIVLPNFDTVPYGY